MIVKVAILLFLATFCHSQDVGSLQEAVKRLEELEHRLTQAKKVILSQDQLIKSLSAQNERNQHELRELMEDNQEQLRELKSQQNEISALHENAVMMNSPVAYTAYAGATREYITGDTIQFEKTVTNQGYNYNTATNTFYVANNGIYMFTVSLFTETSDAMTGDIMKNDNKLVQTYAPDTIQMDHATNVVIVECVVGDEIWVQVGDPDGPLEGFPDQALTTFSGLLILRT